MIPVTYFFLINVILCPMIWVPVLEVLVVNVFIPFINYINRNKNVVIEITYKYNIDEININPNAINATRMNAQTAGVDHIIDFDVCDFRDTKVPSENPGVVMFNPEYGERLGEYEELEIIYKAIGDFLKKDCQYLRENNFRI